MPLLVETVEAVKIDESPTVQGAVKEDFYKVTFRAMVRAADAGSFLMMTHRHVVYADIRKAEDGEGDDER